MLGAWYPAGLGLFVVAAAAFVLAVPIAGAGRMALRGFGIAVVAAVGGMVLLFPWPLAYAHTGVDKAALGFAFRPDLDLSQILRFDTGPASAGWMMWGLVVAAAVPLFVATGDRLAWTARGWLLALVGWAVVWVPARFFPDTSVLPPEAGLTLAALGLALCLGIAVSVFVDGIHSFKFGWRQPAVILGAVAILLPALAFTGDVFDGRWGAPTSDWTSTLAFTQSLTTKGDFRMLWVGDPTVLPLDPVVLRDGTGYTLTRNGPGDVTEQWRAPEHDADHVVDRALDLATAGLTNRLGRMLAPMGVRYVVVPSTQGPGGGAAASVPRAVRTAMAQQLDFAQLRSSAGLVLYENLAYVPHPRVRSPVASRSTRRARTGPRSAPTWPARNRSRRRPPAPAPCCGVRPTTREWSASSRRHVACATRRRSAGPTATASSTRGPVTITFDAQWQRWAMLAGALVLWILVVWRWRRTRVRRDPVVRATDVRTRRERRGASTGARSTTSSTTTRSGGSGCERPAPRPPPPAAPARCAAVRSSSSCWPRSSPRSWCSRARPRASRRRCRDRVAAGAHGA